MALVLALALTLAVPPAPAWTMKPRFAVVPTRDRPDVVAWQERYHIFLDDLYKISAVWARDPDRGWRTRVCAGASRYVEGERGRLQSAPDLALGRAAGNVVDESTAMYDACVAGADHRAAAASVRVLDRIAVVNGRLLELLTPVPARPPRLPSS